MDGRIETDNVDGRRLVHFFTVLDDTQTYACERRAGRMSSYIFDVVFGYRHSNTCHLSVISPLGCVCVCV